MGTKILIAILALVGLTVLIDKVANTQIFDTLYNKFIEFVQWLANLIGGKA